MEQNFANKCIPALKHPSSYSLELAPGAFYLFPKVKRALKGTNYQSVNEVKLKTLDLLNRVSADDLQRFTMERWKIRIERCIDWGRGGVVEGNTN
jgi:hypothetical protein